MKHLQETTYKISLRHDRPAVIIIIIIIMPLRCANRQTSVFLTAFQASLLELLGWRRCQVGGVGARGTPFFGHGPMQACGSLTWSPLGQRFPVSRCARLSPVPEFSARIRSLSGPKKSTKAWTFALADQVGRACPKLSA